jgi:voltage-dependent potassium channel beta subunit
MSMSYRRLGSSGLKVSALSFGAWITFGKQIGNDLARQLLHTAYEAGVNFFDNAEAYADGRAEIVMGEILRESGWRRSSYLVSSKVFFGDGPEGPNETGLSRKHVHEACDAALRRLQVDYLDLYFCHRPDPETPIVETARAMHDLVSRGKVLYWGTSEWTAAQLAEAYAVCDRLGLYPPQMEQPQYNLFHRDRVDRELVPHFRQRGLGATIWSPLGSGLLTGKYNDGIPPGTRLDFPGLEWLRESVTGPGWPGRIAAVKKLSALAGELGATLPQLSLAWCLANPHVSTVILGASRVEQLKENLGALAVTERLTPEVLARIDRIVAAPGA